MLQCIAQRSLVACHEGGEDSQEMDLAGWRGVFPGAKIAEQGQGCLGVLRAIKTNEYLEWG